MSQEQYIAFWKQLSYAYPISKGEIRLPIASSFIEIAELDISDVYDNLKQILQQALVLSKKNSQLQNDASYKSFFGDGHTGVVRFDCVVSTSGNVKVLELNADYPDGLLMHDATYSALCGETTNRHLKHFTNLFDKQKAIFIAFAKEAFFQDAYYYEKQLLEEEGFTVFIGALEELDVRHNTVCFQGHKIDMIRRCLELNKIDTSLLARLAHAGVSFSNTFDLRVAGYKSLLEDIQHAYIPKTYTLNDANKKRILDEQDAFIIKPFDGAEGFHIYFGKDSTKDEWRNIIQQNVNKNYIAQEYVELSKKKIPFYNADSIQEKELHFDFCPHFFIKDGSIIGDGHTLVRFSENKVVNVMQGGGIGYMA